MEYWSIYLSLQYLTTKNMTTTINSFSLTVDGLTIIYTANQVHNTLILDPGATCDIFEDLRIIESFAIDTNGEPVILGEREHDYQDEEGYTHWTVRPVYIHWCDFIKSFTFYKRYAEIIAEQIESGKAYRQLIARINTLLAPVSQPEQLVTF